jgi:cytochrome c biogenesis protein CcmG, thiol:disulfide interchange protein DsbE
MKRAGFSRRLMFKGAASTAVALPWVSGGCATGGSGGGSLGETVGSVVVGQPMPDLALHAAGKGGTNTTLSAFKGRVVLLDVWASWCEPCKIELPMLDDMAHRLAPKNVVIAAVSIDQEAENMRHFLATRKTWAVKFFHDPAGAVAERLAPPKMPTSYIIDQQGVVRMINTGFEAADAKRIERRLSELAG